MRQGQFFIITAVLVAGALLTTTTVIASSHTVDYSNVLDSHSTDVVENIAQEVQEEWWNSSWSYRRNVVVDERSGRFLENESVAVTVEASRSRLADDCSDIRVVDGGGPQPWINTTACNVDTYSSETDAVARYTMDRGEGDTVVDVTWHGHNGTRNGAEWVSGRFSGGLFFGPSDSVEVDDHEALDMEGGGFTASFWARFREQPAGEGGWRQVFVKGDGDREGATNYGVWLHQNLNGLRFQADPDGQVDTGSVETGRWYHVAAVYDEEAEEIIVYLDGKQEGTDSVSMTGASSNSEDLYMGESPESSAADMVMDDLRIYNQTFSENTIQGIARNGVGVNVSADLDPLEEKTFQVYYGNPSASHPGHERSELEFTSLDDRPRVSVGTYRSVTEAMKKMQFRIEDIDAGQGADIRLLVRRGCNLLTYRSPRTALERDLC